MAAVVSRNQVNLDPDLCCFCYLLWKGLLTDVCSVVKSCDCL